MKHSKQRAMAHSALLLLVLLGVALGVSGQAELIAEAAPKLQLPVEAVTATAFVSRFGAAKPMSAVQIGMANNQNYIPQGEGPDYGVPDDVINGMGYKPWNEKMKSCKYYGCPQPAPNPAPYYPTIYEWASNIPDQSISVQIMDIIGADVFKGPFTGTLFLPTNAAWAAYLARWRVPIVQNNSRAQEFYANFFIRLLQYHTLLLRVYGAQMNGFQYSTVYANLNNYPHKVTFGSNSCNGGSCGGGCNSCSSSCSNGCNNPAVPPCSTCDAWYGNGGWEWKHGKKSYHFWSPAPSRKKHFVSFYECTAPCSGSGCANQRSGCSGSGCSGSGCSGSGCSGGCNSGGCSGGCNGGSCGGGCNSGGCGCAPANFLIDEQKNVVTFDQIDKFVFGGGVIHTINQVLEPNDIFPSLTAAINSSAVFSDLRIAFDRIENEGNFSLLPQLEEIPGTVAAPVNEAFAAAGVNVNTANVAELQNIIAYHFCAFTRAYRLLYYPFNGRPGKNPCLTILSRAYLLDYGLSWKHINNGVNKPPEMWINYAGGVYPNGLIVKRSNILIADLTMPVHTGAVVADLIMPPSNLPPPGRLMTTSARNPVRLQLSSLIESGGMTNAWKEGRSNTKRRATRKSRNQVAHSNAADRQQVDADADDDQVRRMKSLDTLNARPLDNGRRLFSLLWWGHSSY